MVIDLFSVFLTLLQTPLYVDFYIIGFSLISIMACNVFLMHKNLIVLLICIEISIVTLVYLFLVQSFLFDSSLGLFFGYLLLIMAGAESALALSIVTAFFFVEQHINVEYIKKLKG